MKTLKFIIILTTFLAFVLPSCKKGDNDPWLSFRSRKNRICGKWDLKSGTSTYKYYDTTESVNYTGSNAEITYSTDADGVFSSGTIPYTEKWTINKDETYTIIKNNYEYYLTVEGFWSFGKKDEELDLKNKESIIFRITSKKYVYNGSNGNPNGTFLYTYTGSYCPFYNYTIDELKNKEIILKYEGASNQEDFSEHGTGTFTFTQEGK
jgi:hypothetical protein